MFLPERGKRVHAISNNRSRYIASSGKVTASAIRKRGLFRYASAMVTRIYKHRPRTLYIKEWQKHWGLSRDAMAGRLGIEPESYSRLIKSPPKLTWGKLCALADAMGHNMEPTDFHYPPGQVRFDAQIERAPKAIQETAREMMEALLKKRA